MGGCSKMGSLTSFILRSFWSFKPSSSVRYFSYLHFALNSWYLWEKSKKKYWGSANLPKIFNISIFYFIIDDENYETAGWIFIFDYVPLDHAVNVRQTKQSNVRCSANINCLDLETLWNNFLHDVIHFLVLSKWAH